MVPVGTFINVEGFLFPRETLEPWYVTGLCDGEASFTYGRQKSGYIALYFSIKMIGGDRPLLNSLRRFFGGAGNLYTAKARVAKGHSGYSKEAVLYRVSSRADLERVVDHFDAYPMQGAKARSYEIWREMVLLKRGFSFNPRGSKSPPAELLNHRQQLEALAVQLSASCLRNGAWIPPQPGPPGPPGLRVGLSGHPMSWEEYWDDMLPVDSLALRR